MSSDPAIVADEVRAQVTEVVLICNRILATAGHQWAIQAAGAGIILIRAIQKAATDGRASTYRANFEGVICFRVQAKHTAGRLLGPTEDLLIDPTTGLRKGEAIYRDHFTDAARDCRRPTSSKKRSLILHNDGR